MELVGINDKFMITTVILVLDLCGIVWICYKHHKYPFITSLHILTALIQIYQYVHCWGYYWYGTEVEILSGKYYNIFGEALALYIVGIVSMIDDMYLHWTILSCFGDILVNWASVHLYHDSSTLKIFSIFQVFVMIIYRIWLIIPPRA